MIANLKLTDCVPIRHLIVEPTAASTSSNRRLIVQQMVNDSASTQLRKTPPVTSAPGRQVKLNETQTEFLLIPQVNERQAMHDPESARRNGKTADYVLIP